MRVHKYIVFLLAALLVSCQREPEVTVSVKACAGMPGGGRAAACACALDGKAYVFAGRDSIGNYTNSLWEYAAATDTWKRLSDCPGVARVNATMVAHDGMLYMGTGYAAKRAYNNSSYLRDWWQYDPSTGQWTQLADFPNANTVAPLSYSIGGKIYTIYGFGYGFTNDICIYDPEADTWSQLPSVPRAHACCGGRGAMAGGRLYFGLGYNTYNLTQWYEADIENDKWVARRSLPGKGREFAACTASDEYVYIFGGRYFGGDMTGGEIFDSYLRYSPDKDQWAWCGTMPCGRAENQIAVSINGKVYFGLGENEKGQLINRWYCIE